MRHEGAPRQCATFESCARARRYDPRVLAGPVDRPNQPRRRSLRLAFVGIAFSGVLGGLIGYGLVDTTCSDRPTVAQQLLEQVPRYHAHVASCTWKLLGAALLGTIIAGIGAGIVALLLLRAQSEWRTHPPGRQDSPPGINRGRSGGTPPRR